MEYESLTLICFSCGRCRHVKGDCPYVLPKKDAEGNRDNFSSWNAAKAIKEPTIVQSRVENKVFGDWMIVQRR